MFALWNGVLLSPAPLPLQPATMKNTLQQARSSFLSQNVTVDEKTSSISIPEIFEWYSKDFFADAPKYGDVLSYILRSIPAGGTLYGQLSKLNLSRKLELSQTAVSPGCNFDVFAAETKSIKARSITMLQTPVHLVKRSLTMW